MTIDHKIIESLQGRVNLVGLDEGIVDGRLDHGGGDRIDTYAVLRQFHRQMLGQGVQAGLG